MDHAAWGGIHGLVYRASRMASMGRRPWLRALTRWERIRQWRFRVARVRRQPWTLAASLNPRIADSDPLFVGGTSNRVVNSHTWWALRLRR